MLEAFIGSREPLALTQIAIEEKLGGEEAVLGLDTQQQLRDAGSLQTAGNILKVTEKGSTSPYESDEIPPLDRSRILLIGTALIEVLAEELHPRVSSPHNDTVRL